MKTDYVCSVAGNNSLINVIDEPIGLTCANGGIKIETGIDNSDNGTLDAEEIQITRFICNGVDGINQEVRIDFNISGTWETSSNIILGANAIYNFDLNHYVNADSVYLGGLLTSLSDGATCTLELYDLTNGAVIANSSVSTTSNSQVWVTSDINFIENIPNVAVDLGLRLSSDNGGTVRVRKAELVLIDE